MWSLLMQIVMYQLHTAASGDEVDPLPKWPHHETNDYIPLLKVYYSQAYQSLSHDKGVGL